MQEGISTVGPNFGLTPEFEIDTQDMVSGEYLKVDPNVKVTDASGGPVAETQRVVFIDLLPVSPESNPLAELELEETDNTCCRHPKCSDLHMACCDCANPRCVSCTVPVNGVASWKGARVTRAGTFGLRYFLHEEVGDTLLHVFNDTGAARQFTIVAVGFSRSTLS